MTNWDILCYNIHMNNKTKNLIAFAFTAFVFVFATQAHSVIASTSNNFYINTPGQYSQNQYEQSYRQSFYQYSTQAPKYNTSNKQDQAPQTGYSAPVNNQPVNNPNPVVSSNTSTNTNTTKTTTVRRVAVNNAQPKTVQATQSQNQVNDVNVGVVKASDVNQVQENNLTALSMRGNNTFMPDTVFEWLLTIIFILVIIIIVRLMSKKHGHGDHH